MKKFTTREIVFLALLVALNIVLTRIASIRIAIEDHLFYYTYALFHSNALSSANENNCSSKNCNTSYSSSSLCLFY
ncbi:hypothetical protein [Caldanaerobacter subterraneus]|nr:hypothetical protein [Caldanaerobacter subterraneus]